MIDLRIDSCFFKVNSCFINDYVFRVDLIWNHENYINRTGYILSYCRMYHSRLPSLCLKIEELYGYNLSITGSASEVNGHVLECARVVKL